MSDRELVARIRLLIDAHDRYLDASGTQRAAVEPRKSIATVNEIRQALDDASEVEQ